MPEPVRCLGCIFADEICRGVAAVAGGNRAMRRLEPAVELLLHDMAVSAGRRIIREVGPPLGIGEGIDADANGNTDNHPKQDALDHARFHLCFSPYYRPMHFSDLCTFSHASGYSNGLNFLNHLNGLNYSVTASHHPALCRIAPPH